MKFHKISPIRGAKKSICSTINFLKFLAIIALVYSLLTFLHYERYVFKHDEFVTKPVPSLTYANIPKCTPTMFPTLSSVVKSTVKEIKTMIEPITAPKKPSMPASEKTNDKATTTKTIPKQSKPSTQSHPSHPSQSSSSSTTFKTDLHVCDQTISTNYLNPDYVPESPNNAKQTSVNRLEDRQFCEDAVKHKGVVIGLSWGMLRGDQRVRFDKAECNE